MERHHSRMTPTQQLDSNPRPSVFRGVDWTRGQAEHWRRTRIQSLSSIDLTRMTSTFSCTGFDYFRWCWLKAPPVSAHVLSFNITYKISTDTGYSEPIRTWWGSAGLCTVRRQSCHRGLSRVWLLYRNLLAGAVAFSGCHAMANSTVAMYFWVEVVAAKLCHGMFRTFFSRVWYSAAH